MLTSLDLSFNELDAEAGTAIAEALRFNAVLTECTLLKNGLDVESAKMLAKIGTEKRIMLSGMKQDQTEANFKSQGLNPADGILIASDLAFMAVLKSINLSNNYLDAEAGKALASALKENAVLKKLNLRLNNLGEAKQTVQDAAHSGLELLL